ncbi:MAG: glycosyltransferase family A protein [Lachnospiraceae bacterium]|nr:glycosyltransferase family A protein [Lachnospiraceae bacterium]
MINIISIIVPIYHGKKYISSIIDQTEIAARQLDEECKVELVLVNDDPQDVLQQYDSHYIDILTLNTKYNRGIHGARVYGLSIAKGEFVVFLDQDDRILPLYLKTQYALMRGADAVVCKAIHEGKPFYGVNVPFEEGICLKQMIGGGNAIISAGQVMLRKTSISQVWINNIMRHNGADDWFLWISMMGEKKKFALNPEILFEHVVEGSNTSWDTVAMQASENEAFDIIHENHVLDLEHEHILEKTLRDRNVMRLRELDKYRKMSFLYNQWLMLWENEQTVADYLKQFSFFKVSIYGITPMAMRLYRELSSNAIEVDYFIDRNAAYLENERPIYTLDDELPEVDLVIISLVERENEIRKNIQEKLKAKVVTIRELIDMCSKG